MATTRKRWPNYAEQARLDAIALTMRSLQQLRPILADERLTQADVVRRVGAATDSIHEVANQLRAVGPRAT